MGDALDELPPARRTQFLTRVALKGRTVNAPKNDIDWVKQALTRWGLLAFIGRPKSRYYKARHGPPRDFVDAWWARIEGDSKRSASKRDLERLMGAAIRVGLEAPNENDEGLLEDALATFINGNTDQEDNDMTTPDFWIDSRGLPPNDDGTPFDRQAYQDEVSSILEASFGVPRENNQLLHAVITGMLLLDEQFSTKSGGFKDAVRKRWIETLGETPEFGEQEPASNRDVYKIVAETIASFPGRVTVQEDSDTAPDADKGNISVQEFASVSRYVVSRGHDVPLGHPSFRAQVRVGLDKFVAGPAPFDSLTLPPLTGDDGQDVEIEPENIRAVAMIWAASRLERLRLIHACDRITELFMNGLLPIGFDGGGKLLDSYHWDAEDRLSEPARMMHYSRIVGAPGGDVSNEVRPNTSFETHLLRFVSTIVEWYRKNQQSFHPQMHNSEPIRKAGRDLAANASLYGWGGAHFAARRLNAHISQAFTILNEPSIQKAYGVTNPWQVIERVAQAEFGQAPNIVRHRTEAEAGKRILDLVARYFRVWSDTRGQALFAPLSFQFGQPVLPPNPLELERGGPVLGPQIQNRDRDDLVVQAQYLIAVRGVSEDEVDELSEPTEATLAPSVPSYGGFGGQGGNGSLQQLKDMVSGGETPSLDQLRQMLPGLS